MAAPAAHRPGLPLAALMTYVIAAVPTTSHDGCEVF